jgi:hypothetical protein
VSEFDGPHANDDAKAPFFIRIRVNEYPPPSLHKYLERRGPVSLAIAESPVLNLFARAKETPLLGAWLADWHKAWLREDLLPPEPPKGISLVAEIVHENLSEEFPPLASLGDAWRGQGETYLWTARARALFEPWYRGK